MEPRFWRGVRNAVLPSLALWGLIFWGAHAAFGQSVQQSGNVTPNTAAIWNSVGVIKGGVTATDSPLTTFGVTRDAVDGFCVSSARQTAVGRNALCFQAATSGPAKISLQNYGTASAQNLQFVINGTSVTLPSGGGSFVTLTGAATSGHVPCFLGTAGVVQDCGLALSSGTITTGVWQGTPVAVLYGGTGASTAAAARTNLGLGTISTQDASAVAITGGTVTGLPSPTQNTDAANKSYVDATSTGLHILAQSRLASAAVMPNTPTYANGASGVGATLTAGSNSTLTVDGVVANLNDVVLVKDQAAPAQNGIYTVTTAGSGGAAWVLTRATYFDQAAEMLAGSYTFITAGSTNVSNSYVLATTVGTVGTNAVTWNQFSSTANTVSSLGGTTGAISLGGGLTIAASTLNTSAGVSTGVAGAITSAPSLSSSNCGKPVYAGGNAFYTVALGAASGFTANCVIEISNTDVYPGSGRGKRLTINGLSPDTVLSPGQYVRYRNVSSAWVRETPLEPWFVQAAVTYYVDSGGSDTAGVSDGLAAGASAFATRGHCATVAYTLTYATGVNCSVTGGQAIQELVAVFFPLPGGGVLTFTSNGGASTWKPANSGYALQFGDGALVAVDTTTFDTTGVTTPVGYVTGHNFGVLDVGATVTVTTGALSNSMFICDYETHFNINNGLTVTNAIGNTLGFVYSGCPRSVWNINGPHTFNSTPVTGRFAYAQNLTSMTFQGNVTFTGTLSTSVSLLSGNSVLSNFSGATLPGGTPTGSSGGQYCLGVC